MFQATYKLLIYLSLTFTKALGLPTFSRLVTSLGFLDIVAPSLNVSSSSTSTLVQVSEVRTISSGLEGECDVYQARRRVVKQKEDKVRRKGERRHCIIKRQEEETKGNGAVSFKERRHGLND